MAALSHRGQAGRKAQAIGWQRSHELENDHEKYSLMTVVALPNSHVTVIMFM
jgi:hypothetical protein